MGMSTRVEAYRDLDGKFKEMIEIKDFCDSKKVSYPKEVHDYFGKLAGEDSDFIAEELSMVPTKDWVKYYNSNHQDGYELDVRDIPPEVKTIRFVNSY